jgi:phosphoribosylamine-glycine ligase
MVTGLGETISQTRDLVYGAIGQSHGIYFEGMQIRKDIGARKRK